MRATRAMKAELAISLGCHGAAERVKIIKFAGLTEEK
jgi:hypothetical protein